jgi:hypothetical protein
MIELYEEIRFGDICQKELDCYYIYKGRIMKDDEIFGKGKHRMFTILKLNGGEGGDYNSTSDDDREESEDDEMKMKSTWKKKKLMKVSLN